MLQKLLEKIYNIGPVLLFRQMLRRKLEQFLTTQNQQIVKEINIRQDKIFEVLENKIDLQINLSHETINRLQVTLNKLDSIHDRQDYIANFYGYFSLINDFSIAVKKIISDDYETIPQYNALILIELLKNKTSEGGIWELKDEIDYLLTPGVTKSILDLDKVQLPDGKWEGKKILIVSGMFPNVYHGGGLRLVDIIIELSKKNTVDLYSIFDDDLDQDSLPIVEQYVRSLKLVKYNEINIQSITDWMLEQQYGEKYYDVIQCEYPHTIEYINPLKKYGGKVGFTFMECLAKSFIIKLYNLIEEKQFDQMSEYVRQFWSYSIAEKRALDNADFSIAMTVEDADVLQRLSPVEPYVIPTCVSTFSIIESLKKYSDISSKENSVAFLGFYGHYPNIESLKWYLTKIHPLVKKEIPNYEFYIIGRGDTSMLKELIEGDKNVIFVGTVGNIVPHLRGAKVCILPLISGAGVRGKLNQYSIAGRPSVSTSIGNKGLKYKHGENILIADTATEFAESIVNLLTDETLYNKISRNAEAYARKEFTWQNQIIKLFEIYYAA